MSKDIHPGPYRAAGKACIGPNDYRVDFDLRSTAQMHAIELNDAYHAGRDSLVPLLQCALDEWAAFDGEEAVSGADLVDWFAEYRNMIKAELGIIEPDIDSQRPA